MEFGNLFLAGLRADLAFGGAKGHYLGKAYGFGMSSVLELGVCCGYRITGSDRSRSGDNDPW